MKSLSQMFKTILEQKLAEKNIAWVRKDGGLQLALFDKPIIKIYEESISIGLCSDTSGYHGSKCYQYLEIKHGDVTCPDCDPEATIDKILRIADSLNALMDEATNKDEIAKMRMVALPSGTAQKVVKAGFAKRGFRVSTSIDRGTITAINGDHRWTISQLRKDGAGNLFASGYMNTAYGTYPLDDVLDELCSRKT